MAVAAMAAESIRLLSTRLNRLIHSFTSTETKAGFLRTAR